MLMQLAVQYMLCCVLDQHYFCCWSGQSIPDKPGLVHQQVVERSFKYLCRTSDLMFCYHGGDLRLTCFGHDDWTNDKDSLNPLQVTHSFQEERHFIVQQEVLLYRFIHAGVRIHSLLINSTRDSLITKIHSVHICCGLC